MIILENSNLLVYKIACIRCNCYLISKGNIHILIDTSTKIDKKKILTYLDNLGIKHLSAIVLTHTHTDHVANAAFMEKYFSCPVYVLQQGIHFLKEGYCKLPKGTMTFTKIVYTLEVIITHVIHWNRFTKVTSALPIEPDTLSKLLHENIQILETPGHSDDSLSIVINNTIAIVGDTMVHRGKMILPPFGDNPELLCESWEKLLKTGCSSFYPAHGNVTTKKEIFEQLQKLKNQSFPITK